MFCILDNLIGGIGCHVLCLSFNHKLENCMQFLLILRDTPANSFRQLVSLHLSSNILFSGIAHVQNKNKRLRCTLSSTYNGFRLVVMALEWGNDGNGFMLMMMGVMGWW